MGDRWGFFENINEIVYVADIENHELVYMNKKALEAFGIGSLEEVRGLPCHRILRNSVTPCAFCCRTSSKAGTFEQQQYFNQYLDRHFLLRSTLLTENGRQYRLEMALDISSQEQQRNVVQSVQNLEAVINEGLRVALLERTPDRSLEVLLAYLGKALAGERTYIFEKNPSGGDDNTYEWTAPGVRPEKENLQNVPPEVCASWYRNFSIGRHIVINGLEDIRCSDPLQYENLKQQDIHSLVVVPLYDEGRIIGFYGVDNPPVKSLEYTSNMLQTAAYFIVSSLRRRNLVRELEKRSHNVLYALNVDYLGIYQADFSTDACVVYRENKFPGENPPVSFAEGYRVAMEKYISRYVLPRDQERLRTVTKKEYILAQLKTKKKFCPVPGEGQFGRAEKYGNPLFHHGEGRGRTVCDFRVPGCKRSGGAGGKVQIGGKTESGRHPGGRQDRYLDHRTGGGLRTPDVCGQNHADASGGGGGYGAGGLLPALVFTHCF